MNEKIELLFADEYITRIAAIPMEECRVVLPRKLPNDFIPATALFFLIPYDSGEKKNRNISRYAVPRDYHLFLKELSNRMEPKLCGIFPDYHFRFFGDNSPLDERYCAVIGGLGILGDNGLLISEEYGTYQFVAEILTDLPIQVADSQWLVHPLSHCEHCGACQKNCPIQENQFGITECLSAVTQTKHPEQEEQALAMMAHYKTAWGCDLCQSVCMHNKGVKPTPIPFFLEKRIDILTSEMVEEMSDEEFATRAFAWRGRACILRNLKYLEKQR